MSNTAAPDLSVFRPTGRAVLALLAALGFTTLAAIPTVAQEETAKALSERSAIVVAGKVVRVNASLEPLQPASPRTVVIQVTRMYSGAEIAGDQKGRMATVILSGRARPLRVGAEAMFFGNPRFVGRTLTIASEGELPSGAAGATPADVNQGVQTQRDQPLRDRMATASNVFRGRVESERPLSSDGAAAARQTPSSEHDPEWHVASVRVITSLRGSAAADQVVNVLFPASRDIVWFNAPKLTVGQEAIFITHAPDRNDAAFMRAPGVSALLSGTQIVEVVSQPFDVRPVTDEARIRALVGR